MGRKKAILTAGAFLSLAINGLVLTALGASLPLVQELLDIDLRQSGFLMAVLQTGFTLFSLVAGVLSDRYQRERILALGCCLLGAGSFFFCSSLSYQQNLVMAALIGCGIGTILSSSNTLLVSLYPQKKGSILNIHHIFFGLGSLAGPLLIGALVATNMHWKLGFSGLGVFLGGLGLYFIMVKSSPPEIEERKEIGESLFKQIQGLLKDQHFWILLGVNALSMGVQVTIMLLGVTFLIEAKEVSLSASGLALSVFSICIMVGRFICSRLTERFHYATIILTLLWFQGFILVLVWLLPGSSSAVLMAFSGLAFSGIYPTSLALSGTLFPKVTGSALGVLSTGGGLGTVLLCWLTGYVADLTHMNTGFIVMGLASVIAILLFQFYYLAMREKESIFLKS